MSLLNFTEQGKGFPLIFIHGFCESHEIWTAFVKPFISTHRVICLDLPGFGKSDLIEPPITIDRTGDRVAAWMAEQKISSGIIVGHSLGGYVGLSLADRYPELVRALCLFHSTSFTDSEEKKKNRDRIIEFVLRNGVPPFVQTFVPGLFFNKSHPSIQYVHQIALTTKDAALIGFTEAMRDRIDRTFILRSPNLIKCIIAGVEDASVPIESSREMAREAQNCSFNELSGVGHMGFFEAQEACREIVRKFAQNLT